MKKSIPYGSHWITDEDINAVVEVLRSDWITQGTAVERFEKALCKYTGARYAVCVSSGTAALHIAALTADFGVDDEVIVPVMSFVATANCVLYAQAKPVFADIDVETGNISTSSIEKKISSRTKAIIPVHFAGNPCAMDSIRTIARKHNLIVIEDAAHALGAQYKQSKIGDCSYSHMTIFSFHPVKAITTGEGGAITTNDKELYEKLLLFRNHGITKDEHSYKKVAHGGWYYEMQQLGFNYRITDFQCALGLSQLARLDSFLERRKQIVDKYKKAFSTSKEITLLEDNKDGVSANHLFIIKVPEERRTAVYKCLRNAGVNVQIHYIPIHLHPYYSEKFKLQKEDFPKAEDYYSSVITLPLYPKMNDEDARLVVEAVRAAVN